MKQETLNKRIEVAGLMTDDKYVRREYCATLGRMIKHSGNLKVYDNRLLNKDSIMFIIPDSLTALLRALKLNFSRNFDTINGVAEYYTTVSASEIRKINNLTFKSEQVKLNHEAFQRDIQKSNIVSRHKAEYENAKDYLYYGYGYKRWHEAHSHLSEEEAKIIWDEAFKVMAND